MNKVYCPGCALLIYKPNYADKIIAFLRKELGDIVVHTICCRHEPKLEGAVHIINTCAGCDKRFSSLYDGITTISLWEILANSNEFSFPDHSGLTMSIHDACPIRFKPQVHEAIRALLKKMNIKVIETQYNRTNSICCGDDFYQHIPLEKIHEKMRTRANSMPCEDVCVYCISCIKSMYIGGKNPRYILDLLFNETTEVQTYDTVQWHDQLQQFIASH